MSKSCKYTVIEEPSFTLIRQRQSRLFEVGFGYPGDDKNPSFELMIIIGSPPPQGFVESLSEVRTRLINDYHTFKIRDVANTP